MYYRFLIIFLFIFIKSNLIYSITNLYKFSYDNPESVVRAACEMILKSDYINMTELTELNEKKRSVEITNILKNNFKLYEYLKKQAESFFGYDVINVEVFTNNPTNQLALVSTKWLVKISPKNYNTPEKLKIPLELDPDRDKLVKNNSYIYVDYLLKKFDDKWKIISKKYK